MSVPINRACARAGVGGGSNRLMRTTACIFFLTTPDAAFAVEKRWKRAILSFDLAYNFMCVYVTAHCNSNINFAAEEEKVLAFWEEIDAFQTSFKVRASAATTGACHTRDLHMRAAPPHTCRLPLRPFHNVVLSCRDLKQFESGSG
jgi:hypothetical protein